MIVGLAVSQFRVRLRNTDVIDGEVMTSDNEWGTIFFLFFHPIQCSIQAYSQ